MSQRMHQYALLPKPPSLPLSVFCFWWMASSFLISQASSLRERVETDFVKMGEAVPLEWLIHVVRMGLILWREDKHDILNTRRLDNKITK